MKIDYKKHIENWTKVNAPTGKELGYPECCINEFCQQPPILLKNSKPTKEDKRRYKAGFLNGEFTGFIPCIEHSKKIIQGEIKLEDLIDVVKRDAFLRDFPFA